MPSKLSIHLSGYPNKVYDVLGKMRPSVVKVFNQSSEMNIDAIRRTTGSTIIVYRQYTNLDYHGSADAFFHELGDTLNKLRGRGLLWEGMNEPIVNSTQDAQALNAWTVRFAQLMHGVGERVAGFSWSTGNPPDPSRFVTYLVDAARAVDVHAFHEYYSTWGGESDWLRYRAFEAALPPDARKPVVITEAGLDDYGTPNYGGYRGKKTPQQYLEILKAYDSHLMEDPYVLGATVFQWGDGSWPSFDLSPVIDILAAYVAAVGGGASIPQPWPIPVFAPPAPTFSFTVTPEAVLPGQSATLRWDVEGVRAVYLDGQGVSGHGTKLVRPTETTTYILHIVLADGSTKDLAAVVTVNVPPPVSYSFSATPETIILGQSATLQWDVEGVREVYLDGKGVTGHETRSVQPTQTTTYTLHIVLLDGSTLDATATVTVNPQPPTPTFSFSASPESIATGETSTLQWQVTGAQAVSLDGQAVEASGSKAVTPAQTTTYTLHIVFLDGSSKDLTEVVTVTEPQTPTYSFSVTPDSIVAGQTATLQWDVKGVASVLLDGQPVPVSGSREIAPAQTTTYVLRLAFPDNRVSDLTVTLTVMPLPEGATRPPTIVLSRTNIDRLKTYPRPPNDNGRGIHWGVDLRQQVIEQYAPHLTELNIKWITVFAGDELQLARVAKLAWDTNQTYVIARPSCLIDGATPNWAAHIQALKNAGLPAYIQIYNEPGDDREWRIKPESRVSNDTFARKWAVNASQVVDGGGFPGLQILGHEEFSAAVQAVKAIGRTDIWEQAFFVLHNYGANHPPDYPYDALNQQDHPGDTIFEDDTAVLNLLEYAKWMQDEIGFVLPIIGGEGGWEYGAHQDSRYPKLEQPYHAQFHREMYEWFRKRVLSNGEPLPDYLLSVSPWILYGWGADDWYGGPLGDKTDTINAVKSIPLFIRRFSWDSDLPSTPPPTPPPTLPPLEWDARLDPLGVWLKRTSAPQAWRLISARYQGPDESGGTHHVYFKALKANGATAAGVRFIVDWINRDPADQPAVVTTDAKGEANCPLWAVLHPDLKDGPYFTLSRDQASDTVNGLGLPLNQHVNFLLTFQYI